MSDSISPQQRHANMAAIHGKNTKPEVVVRKCEPQFYACEESEAVLRSKLNKYTREKPNYLHVALFFSITDEARDMMENRVKMFSEEFEETIFVIPAEVFSPTSQNQFIDAVAQAYLTFYLSFLDSNMNLTYLP